MNRMTQSASVFFFKHYPEALNLWIFGHSEAITEEMCREYLEWLKTDEGKSYLKGGANYKEELNR